MCVSFQTVTPQQLNDHFKAPLTGHRDWKPEVWQDYLAPIIVGDQQGRQALVGQYGLVPQNRLTAGGKRYSTMNARAETVATLRSYAGPWRDGQLCLVPMLKYFEPNYESGKAQRWQIGMADHQPFAVAGLYRAWQEPDGGTSFSFTQITINADQHPVMRRFHKPDDEKRCLVIVAPDRYDEWLTCRQPDHARAMLTHWLPELYEVGEVVKNNDKPKPTGQNLDLF